MERSQVAGPTLSTTTSQRTGQSPSEANTSVAPNATARRPLASSRDVANTSAPIWRASANAAMDTPPPMPTMSTRSPGPQPGPAQHPIRGEGREREGGALGPRAVGGSGAPRCAPAPPPGLRGRPSAVRPGSRSRGAWVRRRRGPPPWRRGAMAGFRTTSSPTATPLTRDPTDSTTPATSQPGTWGRCGRGWPVVTQRSMWLRALVTGRTRTSSGPTAGSSTSP